MYLKSLVVQGFKSFADKTDIRFPQNITAIVGPNGSGKSNISDAIRWVLGEQSTRNLRGSKMEDVIFAGTDKRSPVGFAEVSLTLDNSDGRIGIDSLEVMVTRRYYRSGESEFFINRQAVRLKDIHELFMDTGLGRDGYSVIGQGKIDEILSVKSDDRRDFFEEAAGISKFRYRKNEAETKLNAAEENLIRIRDIISELEARVNPLKEQAEKATKFLTLRDELRVLEVSCWLYEHEKIIALKNKIGHDLVTAENQTDNIKSSIAQAYAQSEQLAKSLHQKDITIEQQRSRLMSCDGQVATLDGEISVCLAKIASNTETINRADCELQEHDNQLNSILKQISEKKEAIHILERKFQENSTQFKSVAKQSDKLTEQSADTEYQTEQLYTQERIHTKNASQLNAELSSLSSLAEEIKLQCNNSKTEIESKRTELELQMQRKSELSKALNQAQEQYQTMLNKFKGTQLKAEARKNKLEGIQLNKQDLEIKLKTITERINMLEDMERQYDGFSYAVKQVMKQADAGFLPNIRGTISQLITVPDEYLIAIETALGGSVANIVTDSENDAKLAINYLKSGNLGRATFLPMTSVKGGTLSERLALSEDGICGLASELCKYDAIYYGVVSSLLGRVVIAENIDVAIAVAKKYSNRFKIVTLDGQVLNSGGSMTGGSSDKKSGVLSRANELSIKCTEKEQLSKKVDDVLAEYKQSLEAMNKANYDVTVAGDELKVAEAKVSSLKQQQKECSLFVQLAQDYISKTEITLTSLSNRLTELEKKAIVINEKAEFEINCAKDIQNKVQALCDGKADISLKYKQITQQLDVLKEQASKIFADKSSIESAVRELENMLGSISGNKEQRKRLTEEYKLKNQQLEQEIQQKTKDKQYSQGEAIAIREHIKKLGEEKLELESLRNKKEKQCKSQNDELLNLDRELVRLSNKNTQLEDDGKRIIDKLWENYQLTMTTAQAVRISEIGESSYSEAFKRISSIKDLIRTLGSVNVDAIEEYKQVNERYTFLSTQKDDLEQSKNELSKIISDILESMKIIFSKQFELINDNFNQTFNEIFGGGGASVELSDPADILNCGIEINVRIPGKSLKTISLLSGGEKAFVAIALYFAILKVRPAPFCVLDEIEATLDDVNVDRFASYLHKLCDTTQFVVITHRRGTMEKSDMLYGVTMQERGISKLLALNINDVEERLKIDIN